VRGANGANGNDIRQAYHVERCSLLWCLLWSATRLQTGAIRRAEVDEYLAQTRNRRPASTNAADIGLLPVRKPGPTVGRSERRSDPRSTGAISAVSLPSVMGPSSGRLGPAPLVRATSGDITPPLGVAGSDATIWGFLNCATAPIQSVDLQPGLSQLFRSLRLTLLDGIGRDMPGGRYEGWGIHAARGNGN
jgi:hypothetical protein